MFNALAELPPETKTTLAALVGIMALCFSGTLWGCVFALLCSRRANAAARRAIIALGHAENSQYAAGKAACSAVADANRASDYRQHIYTTERQAAAHSSAAASAAQAASYYANQAGEHAKKAETAAAQPVILPFPSTLETSNRTAKAGKPDPAPWNRDQDGAPHA